MKAKLLNNQQGAKTYALILDAGDEVMQTLTDFANDQHLLASHFTAIGAFERVTFRYFDREKREYQKIPLNEQVEVLTFMGDISDDDGKPKIHAHVVVGKRDGTAHGGDVLEGFVYPTLEVVLEETPKHLRRKYDPATGLSLIAIETPEMSRA